MASLVERLRVRSDRRPIYTLDESDEEADLVRKKSGAGPSSDSFERFQRPDTVITPPELPCLCCRCLMRCRFNYT